MSKDSGSLVLTLSMDGIDLISLGSADREASLRLYLALKDDLMRLEQRVKAICGQTQTGGEAN